MTISSVFDFFIQQFVRIVSWVYNLQLPVTDNVSIPFGSFLLAIISIAVCVKIFMHFNEFNIIDTTDVYTTRNEESGVITKYIKHNGKTSRINYYDR